MTEPAQQPEPTEPEDKAKAKADKAAAPPKKADGLKPEVRKERKVGGKVAIELEVSRQRTISWTVIGLVVGTLLVWKLGTVGQWIGVLLILIGAYRAYQLVQTFLHKPGTIIVSEREITLPRGLCMPRPLKLQPSEVTAVYFLRRSVMWNKAAPVLVVEIGPKAIAFPRDWFASEADQRHVVHALLRWSSPKTADKAAAKKPAADDKHDAKPAADDKPKSAADDKPAEPKSATAVDASDASDATDATDASEVVAAEAPPAPEAAAADKS